MKNLLIIILLFIFSPVLLFAQMRIVTNESPPTGFTLEGEFQGTTVTIIKEMMEIIGEDIEIEVLPWSRVFDIAKKNANTIIFTAGRTTEREEVFNFIGPVFTRKHALIKMKENPIKIRKNEDILEGDHRLGGLRGDWRNIYYEDIGADVANTSTKEGALKLLIIGRIDL